MKRQIAPWVLASVLSVGTWLVHADTYGGGTIHLSWEVAPPGSGAEWESFQASVSANYDPEFPPQVERPYGEINYGFEWECSDHGFVETADEEGNLSTAQMYFDAAGENPGDRFARVRVWVTGSAQTAGPDGLWDTEDDGVVGILKVSDWLTASITVCSTSTTTSTTTTTTIPPSLTATRALPTNYFAEVPVVVHLTLVPTETVASYGTVETPPEGWTVSNISHGGTWDVENKNIQWGPFADNNARALSYRATAPAGMTETVTFSGAGLIPGPGGAAFPADGPNSMDGGGGIGIRCVKPNGDSPEGAVLGKDEVWNEEKNTGLRLEVVFDDGTPEPGTYEVAWKFGRDETSWSQYPGDALHLGDEWGVTGMDLDPGEGYVNAVAWRFFYDEEGHWTWTRIGGAAIPTKCIWATPVYALGKPSGVRMKVQVIPKGFEDKTCEWAATGPSANWAFSPLTSAEASFSTDTIGLYSVLLDYDKDGHRSLGWGNVGVVDPHVVAVTFTSNNAILRGLNPNNDTFSSDGDFDLSPPGWQKGNPTDTNNPVSQTKNTRTVVSVGITGIPSGINFVLTGTGDYGPLSYPATGIQSTGDPMVVNGLTSIQALPNRVDIVKGSIDWSVNAPLGDASSAISADRSRENKIYVTWATPGGSGITKKRVEFACFAARGAGPATPPNVTENVANRVQARLAGMAPDAWGTPCVDGWLLLDSGNRGKCDNWAVLMGCCLDILGAGSSSLALVRASSDGGPGKCLDVESKFTIHGTVYLLFDFAGGSPHNFNGWEGCCVTAGHYYAIRPRLKARDDYDMLRRLGRIGITQYWVELQPDSSLERNGAYGIKNVYEQQPIP